MKNVIIFRIIPVLVFCFVFVKTSAKPHIAFINTTYGDEYDELIDGAILQMSESDFFYRIKLSDSQIIPLRGQSRFSEYKSKSFDYVSKKNTAEYSTHKTIIHQYISKPHLGGSIKATMSNNGLFNTTENLNNVYVIAIDFRDICIEGNIWTGRIEAFAYHLTFADLSLEYTNCCSVAFKGEFAGDLSNNMTALTEIIIEKLSTSDGDSLNGLSFESDKRFLYADIGSKEGLYKNTRFAIYGKKKGHIVKKGYARVVEVAENNYLATGDRPKSKLLQISGSNLVGSEILQESHDNFICVSIGYGYTGLGIKPKQTLLGSFSMVNLTLEYRLSFTKIGSSSYVRTNFGYDIVTGSQIKRGCEYNIVSFDHIYETGLNYFNISMGYGHGFLLFHVIEIQPFVNLGVDMSFGNLLNISSSSEKQKFAPAAFVNPGVKLSINCGYPFQLYFQADSPIPFYQSDDYKKVNQYLIDCGYGHKIGIGLYGGFRWNF